jgi:hypothetical protein
MSCRKQVDLPRKSSGPPVRHRSAAKPFRHLRHRNHPDRHSSVPGCQPTESELLSERRAHLKTRLGLLACIGGRSLHRPQPRRCTQHPLYRRRNRSSNSTSPTSSMRHETRYGIGIYVLPSATWERALVRLRFRRSVEPSTNPSSPIPVGSRAASHNVATGRNAPIVMAFGGSARCT